MILISSSLGKSGSTIICTYQEDLLEASRLRSGQAKLYEAYNGRFIETFSPWTVLRLLYINLRYGTIVVKTHSRPSLFLEILIHLKIARATYSYRDIRDVILSAIDHGRREKDSPRNPFVYWTDVESSIPHAIYLLKYWRSWKDFGKVFFICYERLMQNKQRELREMADYLGWKIADEDIEKIVEKREKQKRKSWNFNKGTTLRYKTEMTPSEIRLCNEMFREYLLEEGYEL